MIEARDRQVVCTNGLSPRSPEEESAGFLVVLFEDAAEVSVVARGHDPKNLI
ncbi:MAG: hypothetical protein IPK39_14560 [Sulfuritalea sp.]|nr:hypothetical protein [Sulfuritalea sp.]